MLKLFARKYPSSADAAGTQYAETGTFYKFRFEKQSGVNPL